MSLGGDVGGGGGGEGGRGVSWDRRKRMRRGRREGVVPLGAPNDPQTRPAWHPCPFTGYHHQCIISIEYSGKTSRMIH